MIPLNMNETVGLNAFVFPKAYFDHLKNAGGCKEIENGVLEITDRYVFCFHKGDKIYLSKPLPKNGVRKE